MKRLPRHQLDFADSMRRPVVVCLGVALKPYSIGMELELQRRRSVFALNFSLNEVVSLSDERLQAELVSAVDICCQSERERLESAELLAARPQWHEFSLRRRKNRLNRQWKQWEKLIRDRKAKFEAETKGKEGTFLEMELARFWGYLQAGRTGPTYAKLPGDAPTVTIGAPEMAILIQYLRAQPERLWRAWGDSELDYPVSVARYEYGTHLEQAGKVCLKNDFEDDFDDWVRQQEDLLAQGKITLQKIVVGDLAGKEES